MRAMNMHYMAPKKNIEIAAPKYRTRIWKIDEATVWSGWSFMIAYAAYQIATWLERE